MNALTIYKNFKTILAGFWKRQAVEIKKDGVSEAVPTARTGDVILNIPSNTLLHLYKWTPTGVFYLDAKVDLFTLVYDSSLNNEHDVFGDAWKRLT